MQEVTFSHDGGPYLAYTSTMWLLDEVVEDQPASDGASRADEPDATEVRYEPGAVWAAESGFWRVLPGPDGSPESGPDGDSGADLEVLLAEPTGHVSIYLGAVRGPRIELATDLVARTASAVDVSAVSRMYGLVEGELMWAMDMAAFGHELQSYASARLARRGATARDGSPEATPGP